MHAFHSIIPNTHMDLHNTEPPHGVSKGIYLLKGKETIATRHLNIPSEACKENIFCNTNTTPPTM
jgi:hypothetical protein